MQQCLIFRNLKRASKRAEAENGKAQKVRGLDSPLPPTFNTTELTSFIGDHRTCIFLFSIFIVIFVIVLWNVSVGLF